MGNVNLTRGATFIGEFLLQPRAMGLLLCGSFACAVIFCLSVFPLHFLAGNSPYWQAPRGLVIDSWADISTEISGYRYFVRDAWTLPLFQTAKLGAPDGVNIIFTSIPLLAMAGRLLYRASGLVVNPYGAWTALCFIASALSMTGLVAVLGQRGLAAGLMATASGLCMPALLERWGHLSLMAQWEIPLAFIIYFSARSRRGALGLLAWSLLLAVVALWTFSYLFVMVMGILAAALAQAALDRRLPLAQAASIAAVFALALLGLVFVSGYLANQGSLAAWGFGFYSMNLLSPIVPQFSALFPALGNKMVDATGGQYEGFSYLGAGILLLVLATQPRLWRALARAWPRHIFLVVLLAAFTLFAISNEVYAGVWHVASIPLPASILALASLFRSSGRFIWPCMYLLTAGAIVSAPVLWGRFGGLLLVVAVGIQFVDTAPLRSALAARVAVSAATPLAEIPWADAIRRHAFLRVVPPFGCLADPRGRPAQMALELQLLASQQDVATNTVYAARHKEDCTPPDAAVAAGELRVYLPTDARAGLPSEGCVASPELAVCSRQAGSFDPAALLAVKPQEH